MNATQLQGRFLQPVRYAPLVIITLEVSQTCSKLCDPGRNAEVIAGQRW
jgi:hypothetical protein